MPDEKLEHDLLTSALSDPFGDVRAATGCSPSCVASVAIARYRALLRSLPDTIVAVYDRDLRGVLLEGPALAISDQESFVGRPLAEFQADDYASLETPYREALAGRPTSMEFLSSMNGRVYQLEIGPLR